jgi:hypothetical protein
MTYFWVHMVHYAMATTSNPDGTFKSFLLLNPRSVAHSLADNQAARLVQWF